MAQSNGSEETLSDFVAIYKLKVSNMQKILFKYDIQHMECHEKKHFALCIVKAMNSEWWTVDRLPSVDNIEPKQTRESIKEGVINYFINENENLTQEEKNEFQDIKTAFDQSKAEKLVQIIKDFQAAHSETCKIPTIVKLWDSNSNSPNRRRYTNPTGTLAHNIRNAYVMNNASRARVSELEECKEDESSSNAYENESEDNLSTHSSMPSLPTDSEDEEWERLVREDMNSDWSDGDDACANEDVVDVDDIRANKFLEQLKGAELQRACQRQSDDFGTAGFARGFLNNVGKGKGKGKTKGKGKNKNKNKNEENIQNTNKDKSKSSTNKHKDNNEENKKNKSENKVNGNNNTSKSKKNANESGKKKTEWNRSECNRNVNKRRDDESKETWDKNKNETISRNTWQLKCCGDVNILYVMSMFMVLVLAMVWALWQIVSLP